MIQRLLLATPLAIAWMLITSHVSVEAFAVGLLVSALILALLFPDLKPRPLHELRLRERTVAAIVYTVTLFRDIWLSALDVARRVVHPDLPMTPGLIEVPTGYSPGPDEPDLSTLIAAASAHGITITPGELVIGFEGNSRMVVHCLDTELSTANAASNQAKRLALLRKIFT